MAEFLELIETIKAEEVSHKRIFKGEGKGVRTIAGRETPEWRSKLIETAKFVNQVYAGRRPMRQLAEAMTTSDFPLLFGDIIDRQLLAKYEAWPVTWPNYIKRATVRDFRTVSRHTIDGGEATLSTVPEETEYPARKLTEGRFQYAVQKRGARYPFSWEAMINDDLEALQGIPERAALAARRTEERFATELYVDANGPHASLYTVGNGNIVPSNPALSAAALEAGLTLLSSRVDTDGEPIVITAVELVVPPALEITANQIMNTMERHITVGTEVQVLRGNGLPRNFRISVNPYIPAVASIADGNTSWYLFANPDVGRPALEMGFLRGYEQPQVFIKSPNAQRVGGGMADPMDGDFDTDSVQYKVRHVLGGGRMDPIMTVASEGDGT